MEAPPYFRESVAEGNLIVYQRKKRNFFEFQSLIIMVLWGNTS